MKPTEEDKRIFDEAMIDVNPQQLEPVAGRNPENPNNIIQPTEEDIKEFERFNDPDAPKILKTKTLKKILAEGVPEIKWRIQDIIPERGTVILGGTSGSLKTWTGMDLSLACAAGTPFLDKFETKKCNVLYVDEENGDITIPNRFDKLIKGNNLKEPFDNLFISIFNGIKLDDERSAELLRILIDQCNAKLVIIDSMVRCMVGEEDKSKDVRKIFDNLKPLYDLYPDVAIVILHHTIKGTKQSMTTLRGSGDFAAFADVILMFSNNTVFTNVETVKNRHIAKESLVNFSLKLEESDNQGLKLHYFEQSPEEQNTINECASDIRDWYDNNNKDVFRSKQIIEEMEDLGHKKNTIYSALAKLKGNRDISKEKRGFWKVENPIFTTQETIK